MAKVLGRYTNKLGIWSASLAATFLLLALFMYLQRNNSTVLELDTKWLVIASIPVIVAILRSNIIRRFQGFGIELETRLEDPIGRISVVAMDARISVPEGEKASLDDLYDLDSAERGKMRRLTFVQGRRGRYGIGAIREYLQQLPNLEYLEVRDEQGKFVALLPIELFRKQGVVDEERLYKLVDAIENQSVVDDFGANALTESVKDDESLLTVLPKVRESKYGSLPVTSSNGQLLGIVTTEIVEKRIADAVIAAQKQA